MNGKADITWRSRGILSFSAAFYPGRESARDISRMTTPCTSALTLGITAHHALASPGAFAEQTNNEQPNKLPQGVEEHTDEIACVRNAGRRISAVRLQPLP
jgi:hypothetical protein